MKNKNKIPKIGSVKNQRINYDKDEHFVIINFLYDNKKL